MIDNIKNKYCPAYRCHMCGTLIAGDEFEAYYNDLPELLGKVVQNQRFIGNHYLHTVSFYYPHKCKDGSAGLGIFAGFKRV